VKGPIVFVGHISMDHVKNVNGERMQPGGAALYAAVAARTLFDDVRIVSAVGSDFKYMSILDLFEKKIIKVVNEQSTRFTISYDEKWNAKYDKVIIGAGKHIKSDSIPASWITRKTMIHISPMKPEKVEKIIDRVKRYSPKTKISVNTWSGYMDRKYSMEHIRNIMRKTDIFIVNEFEAKKLAGTDSLIHALNLLRYVKMLVVTLGELGAIIKINGEVSMIPALTNLTEKVVDTTGAGDVWCGSFLATYKITGDIQKAVTIASIISSLKCADWGFNKLLNLKFTGPEEVTKYVLKIRDRGFQKDLTEYIRK